MYQASASFSAGGIDLNNEEQLYALAQMKGGAIADRADELTGKKTGILSTIGDGFKNTFNFFVEDVLSLPLDVVTSAATQFTDKPMSFSEVKEKDMGIGKLIFDKQFERNLTYGGSQTEKTVAKGVVTVLRIASDILADPTTYLTFGAGAFSKIKTFTKTGEELVTLANDEATLAKLIGKEKDDFIYKRVLELADERGLKEADIFTVSTLSKEGQDMLFEYMRAIREGRENDFIKDYAKNLVDKSADAKGVPTMNIDEAIVKTKAMKEAGQLDDAIAKLTYDAALDTEYALKQISQLIKMKPQLAETLIDKGGLKFMGKTILSSQRIESTMKLLPGIKYLDNVTEPVRNVVNRIFNPASVNGETSIQGKEASEYLQKLQDYYYTKGTAAVKEITNLFKDNNITRQEAELLTAAIESGLRPTDKKLSEMWNALHGLDADPKVVPERFTNVMKQIIGINKRNLKEAWDAGIKVGERENYMLHFNREAVEQAKNNVFGHRLSTELKSAKQAEVLKFESLTDPDAVKYGTADYLQLERHDPEMKIKTLEKSYEALDTKYGIKIQDIQNQIIDTQDRIQNFFTKFAEEDFVAMLKRAMPEADKGKLLSAVRAVRESVPAVDFQAMKAARQKALDNASTAISSVLKGNNAKAFAQVTKLVEDIKTLRPDIEEFSGSINNILNNENALAKAIMETEDTALVKYFDGGAEGVDPEALDVLKQLRSVKKQYQDELVKNSIDKDQVSEYLNRLVDEFNQNPVGVKHLVNALAGKETKLNQVIQEMSDKKFELMKQMDELGDLAMMDSKLYRSKQGEIFRATRPQIAELNANGFNYETNSLNLMLYASQNTVKATMMRVGLGEMAERFGRLASQAPPSFREVNISVMKESPVNLSTYLTGKGGEPLVFHPHVAAHIENMIKGVTVDDDINLVVKSFDKLTNLFKASSTSIFPDFHGRNALSNVFLSYMNMGVAVFDPKKNVTTAKLMSHYGTIEKLRRKIINGDTKAYSDLSKELAKPFFVDKSGYQWKVGQLIDLMQKERVAFTNAFDFRVDLPVNITREGMEEIPERLWQLEGKTGGKYAAAKVKKELNDWVNPFNLNNNLYQQGKKFGSTIEDYSRIINFIDNLEKTGDIFLASDRTKMFLFDYNNLSNFEKNYLKRLIPFYTWTRKAIELQAKVLLTDPGKITQQVHLIKGLSNSTSNGQPLTAEEYKRLPNYMKSRFTAKVTKNGTVYIYTDFGTPLEGMVSYLQPNQLLGSVNPFVKLPVEMLSGYSFFRNEKISNLTNASLIQDAPQFIKDIAGYTKVEWKDPKTGKSGTIHTTLNPEVYYAMSNIPIGSRAFNRLFTEINKWGEEDAVDQVLRGLFGIDKIEYDYERAVAQENKKRVKELQDMLDSAGVIYKLEKPLISKTSKVVE